MFELSVCPDGCLVARSIHQRDCKQLYCSVLNAIDFDVVLKSNEKIGSVSKAVVCCDMNAIEASSYRKLDQEFMDKLNKIATGKSISAEQRSQLLAVIANKADAFKWDPDELCLTNLVEHNIPTSNNKPVQQKQYPTRSIARDHMREQVADMLSKGYNKAKF